MSIQPTYNFSITSCSYQSFNLFLRYHWIRHYGEQSLPYQDYQIDSDKTKGLNQGSGQHQDKGLKQNQHQQQNKEKRMDQDKDKGSVKHDRVHVVLEVRAIDPTNKICQSLVTHSCNSPL